MSRRAFAIVAVLAAPLVWLAPADGAEDHRDALRFVQGLRERGYFDLASEYLERLRQDPGTPADLRATVDYEQGRLLLDEAAKTGDLVHRKEMLDQARGKLDAFTRANPGHPLAAEALVQLARLLVERGHLAMLMSEETQAKAEKEPKIAEARASFDQARAAYTQADERLKKAYDAFPRFLPDDDPRKEERERTHNALMDAQLQKAVVDFEQAHTYPAGSPQRAELLDKSRAPVRRPLQALPDPAGRAGRPDVAGQVLRGEGGPRGGHGHLQPVDGARRPSVEVPAAARRLLPDHRPRQAQGARPGRRRGGCAGSRRIPPSTSAARAKASASSSSWPRTSWRSCRRSTRPSDREAAVRRATDALGEVVRYPSPFKAEALALLKVHKPRAAVNARGRGEAELRGGDRTGRPGDGLARMGPRHRPAPGRGPPRRPVPGPRQGQPRPLQHGLLLLHGQALL